MQHQIEELTPSEVVAYLDRYIIGQAAAKRAVAIAIRNRWRRQSLPPEEQREIYPKNLILIGPTGVGKTELARRLADLQRAPFIKVEASKFSQVGYHGRDVDTMIRDLVERGVDLVRTEKMAEVERAARELVEERLVEILAEEEAPPAEDGLEAFTPFGQEGILAPSTSENDFEEQHARLREELRSGALEERLVTIQVADTIGPGMEMFSGQGPEYVGFDPSFLAKLRGMPTPQREARVTVAEARKLLEREEGEKLFDKEAMVAEAIERTEQSGIIFLDEIDKIAGHSVDGSPDVSREGVQRDLLPLVEGCTVYTRHGNVRTDHILFVAAGAFHMTSPDDLIPELQGRFPVRVQLDPLGRGELLRILTEPRNALTRQYALMLGVDGVQISFTPEGLEEIATLADRANIALGDIGARRLHAVIEYLLEGVAFDAPDRLQGPISISREFVKDSLKEFYSEIDLARK